MTTAVRASDGARSPRIAIGTAAEMITYGIGQSSLGTVLVACSGAGVEQATGFGGNIRPSRCAHIDPPNEDRSAKS